MKHILSTLFSVSIFTLIIGAFPLQASADIKYLYVSNASEDTVSVIDSVSGNIVNVIPVGDQPREVVSNGEYIYTANMYGHSISVIDPTTNIVVDTIPLGDIYAERINLSRDGERLCVGDPFLTKIAIVDLTTNTVSSIIPGFNDPQTCMENSDGTLLYVVNQNWPNSNGYISVLDTSDYSTVATINIGSYPVSFTILPDDSKLYVGNYGGNTQGNTVSVIDTETNVVIKTFDVGINPYDLVVHPDGSKVYVMNTYYWAGQSGGTVSVVDTQTDTVATTIPVGDVTNSINLSSDGNRIYVTKNDSGKVAIINSETNFIENEISAGIYPWSVAEWTEQDPVVNISVLSDSSVRRGHDNRNYGASDFMRVRSSGNNRALLKFDEGEIESEIGGGTVLSAKLVLTIIDNGNNWGNGRTVDIHRLTSDWTEGNGTEDDRGDGSGTTWNCATDSDIGDQSKDCSGTTEWEMSKPNEPELHPWIEAPTDTLTITSGLTGEIEYDVKSDVQAFISGSESNFGWIIKKTEEGQNGSVEFGTKESSVVPHLLITYQP